MIFVWEKGIASKIKKAPLISEASISFVFWFHPNPEDHFGIPPAGY